MSDRVVIVGASVGGVRTAQDLRRLGYDGDITVVGEESEQPYDKPPLSKQLLLGKQSEADISLLGEGGWDAIATEARLGVRATSLDIDSMVVNLADGEELEYDALVIATGVRPRTLSPELTELDSVFTVRELRDSRALAARAHLGPVVVVGAGFIGAEIASSFRSLGTEVTMTEALSTPFARALGPEVGGLLTDLHETNGVNLATEAAVTAIEKSGDLTLVRLVDGRVLEAATVVLGIGAVPNCEWLEGSGLKIEDGVFVDAGCAVLANGVGPHAEGVYAIGDVARQVDPSTNKDYRVEHWTNAVEQAHVVARQIVDPVAVPEPLKAPYFWSDQFGTKIQMVGRPAEATSVSLHHFETAGAERTVALYKNAGRLAAAVTLGWPRAIAACRKAWESGSSVADLPAVLADLADRARSAAI
ncbi:FAD-dependent oxidoreductase [Micromonospora sp. NPDC023966]|uniref:NAD(P)/FAD-dependent oxidoreductase n=1 Tax=Micromonospora sp. NPDC023966 TaxID=3154699 RepID=UPI0033C83208